MLTASPSKRRGADGNFAFFATALPSTRSQLPRFDDGVDIGAIRASLRFALGHEDRFDDALIFCLPLLESTGNDFLFADEVRE